MKRNLTGILTLVVLSLTMTAIGAYAQTAVKANVPFGFKVGNVQLPAGTYVIRQQDQSILIVSNIEKSAAVLTTARRDEANKGNARLVFYRSGNHYFLTQIWGGYGTSGLILPSSKLQDELRASEAGPNDGEFVLALNQ